MSNRRFDISFRPQDIYDEAGKHMEATLKDLSKIVLTDTNELVPMKTGKLRRSVRTEHKSKLEYTLSYSRPFHDDQYGVNLTGDEGAEMIFKGLNPYKKGNPPIHKWTTPGTGPDWVNASFDKNLDKWVDFIHSDTRRRWRERKRKQRSKK